MRAEKMAVRMAVAKGSYLAVGKVELMDPGVHVGSKSYCYKKA